jgi:hypothetical protein
MKIVTAIEIALENNQVRALNKIIEFIVKCQNSYFFSFLFEDNAIDLLEKGIIMKPLFESNIFHPTFEFEHWPVIHKDPNDYIMPYNGSKFHLKDKYKTVFGFLGQSDEEENDSKEQKFYKIKYSLNLLPRITFVDGECRRIDELLEALQETSEIKLFETHIVKDFLEF